MLQYGELILEHLLRFTDLFVLCLDVSDFARLRAVSRKFRCAVTKTYIWPGLTWNASAYMFRVLNWTFPTRVIAVPIYIMALDYFIFKNDWARFRKLSCLGAENWPSAPDMRGLVHNLTLFATKNRRYASSRVGVNSPIYTRLRIARILQHLCVYHRSVDCQYIANRLVQEMTVN